MHRLWCITACEICEGNSLGFTRYSPEKAGVAGSTRRWPPHFKALTRHCCCSPLSVRIQDTRRRQSLWRMMLKNFCCSWLFLRGELQFSHLFFRMWHIRQSTVFGGSLLLLYGVGSGLPVVLVGTTAGHVAARLRGPDPAYGRNDIGSPALLALGRFLMGGIRTRSGRFPQRNEQNPSRLAQVSNQLR